MFERYKLSVLLTVMSLSVISVNAYPSEDKSLCSVTDVSSLVNIKYLQKCSHEGCKRGKSYYQSILASEYRRGVVAETDYDMAKRLLMSAIQTDKS